MIRLTKADKHAILALKLRALLLPKARAFSKKLGLVTIQTDNIHLINAPKKISTIQYYSLDTDIWYIATTLNRKLTDKECEQALVINELLHSLRSDFFTPMKELLDHEFSDGPVGMDIETAMENAVELSLVPKSQLKPYAELYHGLLTFSELIAEG